MSYSSLLEEHRANRDRRHRATKRRAIQRLKCQHRAADVVQETEIRYLLLIERTTDPRGLEEVRPETSVRDRIWFGIDRRVILEEFRKTVRDGRIGSDHNLAKSAHDPERHPDEAFFHSDNLGRLRRAWSHLPEGYRNVLYLHYYQSLKYREIAEVLGIPIGTVKTHIHRALSLLKTALDEP